MCECFVVARERHLADSFLDSRGGALEVPFRRCDLGAGTRQRRTGAPVEQRCRREPRGLEVLPRAQQLTALDVERTREEMAGEVTGVRASARIAAARGCPSDGFPRRWYSPAAADAVAPGSRKPRAQPLDASSNAGTASSSRPRRETVGAFEAR